MNNSYAYEHTGAMAEIVAQWEADGRAYAVIAARIASDPRANALAKAAAVASPITMGGEAGFRQMMASLMSSKHWRKKRAGCLNVARAAQIKGDHGTARAFLAKAAWCRKSEMIYRAAEAADEPSEAAAWASYDTAHSSLISMIESTVA